MDRYRHFVLTHHGYTTKPNRALQYVGLSTNLMMITAEMGRLNGFDLYNYVAPAGENIKLPLLFYADFYITKDASIKGGFYEGRIPGLIIMTRLFSLYGKWHMRVILKRKSLMRFYVKMNVLLENYIC